MQILFTLLAGTAAAFLAKKQGKSPQVWFAIAAVLAWAFPALLLIFLLINLNLIKKAPSRGKNPQAKRSSDGIVTLDIDPTEDLSSNKEHTSRIWYFLDDEKNTVGPMSFTVLHQKWKDGKILKETLLWNESLKGWKSFKELFPQAKA